MKQRIEVITIWYNEQFLAPFFLTHYSFADRINILLDADTSDNTARIIARYPNASVQTFRFGSRYDNQLKMDLLNRTYHSMHCDWVICADADEFVFTLPKIEWLRKFLEMASDYNVVNASMWNVFRHKHDANLNMSVKPIVMQRRHGDPDVSNPLNAAYVKPLICRPGAHGGWGVGQHSYVQTANTKLCGVCINGVHWANADPLFCVERRIKNRRDRYSQRDIDIGHGFHNRNITEEDVLKLCKDHENDPQLF